MTRTHDRHTHRGSAGSSRHVQEKRHYSEETDVLETAPSTCLVVLPLSCSYAGGVSGNAMCVNLGRLEVAGGGVGRHPFSLRSSRPYPLSLPLLHTI